MYLVLYLGHDVDPGRLLLRSGGVGHALGGDPPYQRGRRLLPPYAARLVAFGFLLFLLFIKL